MNLGINNMHSKIFEYYFNLYGTDKARDHGYHNSYSKLFKDRYSVKNIFEIGIGLGFSKNVWKVLYPNAKLFFVDNNLDFLINEDGVFSYYADQNNIDTFKDFRIKTNSIPYDLVIDDASHNFELTYSTFLEVVEWLSPTGIYVIEDIKSMDVEKWKLQLDLYKDKYTVEYVDLTDTYKTDYDDSYLIIIRRISE